ncbi:MAG: hypothetical protein KDA27_06975 [Candidatus Eisenbacteria bacterium]|uniref:SGNH hydrolase-type esterase domain-containing protein n=1 Tax=Eiseniibacteriota bacterium TaxID=2212470 RepID=A0A956SCJ3_UNCEI|nr:hypothetical protein [Candidatus Eisenbacteria bacterium]
MAVAVHVAAAERLPQGKYPDPARMEAEVAALEADAYAVSPPDPAIVCVGSSSMRMWSSLTKDLAPFPVVPRGFGGSTMYDVYTYLDRLVLPLHPSAILLYEGDNDIDFGVAPEDVLEAFHAVNERIHETLPECRVFVLSVKPSGARWHEWADVQEANRLLAAACEESPLLHFLDIATPMLSEDGTLREDIFLADRLHMNGTGYEIWTGVVRPALLKHAADLQVRGSEDALDGVRDDGAVQGR